jgi:phage terminase large subunit-like protein
VIEKDGRIYIPSRIADNPAIDEAEYRRSLMHLPPLVRERLMNGDWSVEENAVFRPEFLRYYVEADGQLELLDPSGKTFQHILEGSCHRLMTIDPAGTSAERAKESKREASYSVLQIWDRPPRELARFLLLRHQVRQHLGFDELCDLIQAASSEWQPDRIGIEGEKLGQAVVDVLKKDLPIECIPMRCRDKLTRAGKLIIKYGRGEIFLPKHETTWRPGLEAEFLAWTGKDEQPSDQIDAAAYAAMLVFDGLPQAIQVGPLIMSS